MQRTILIVDDEPDLVDALGFRLEQEGYRTMFAYDGRGAETLLARHPLPDLVLLDLMLPDISGTELCRQLRQSERTRGLPVIMISARSDEIDRVVGFEIGADDYVVKPFSTRELVLRIKAIFRCQGPAVVTDNRCLDRLSIDFGGHQVWVDNEPISLTALEFRLLSTLVMRRGRVQSRETLLRDIWTVRVGITTRTVDTHIQRLRKKLGAASAYIETVRGVGYRFQLAEGL